MNSKLRSFLMQEKQCISKKFLTAEHTSELSKFQYNKMHTFRKKRYKWENENTCFFFTLLFFVAVPDNGSFKFLITGKDKLVCDYAFCCQ